MSTVLLISGASQGDALGNIARSFKSLFKAAGMEFIEINFAQGQNALNDLRAALERGNIAFAFSFMAMGADLVMNNAQGQRQNMWELARIPFLSIYGDSPAYFFDRHVAPSAYFASLYGFPEHLALRKRLPKINGPMNDIPPILLDLAQRGDINFTAKKAGKLLFLKNGNDPEALPRMWRENIPPGPGNALLEMASALAGRLADASLNQIDDYVLEYCTARNIDIERLSKLRVFFIAQLDDYTRRLKSTLIARTLMAFPVEIRGTGWEHLDFSGKRATLIPECDYAESRGLIRKNLGIIDMSPNTSGGAHDRPARAYGSYTLCLTNKQQGLIDAAPAQDDVSFRFEPESIQAVVSAALAHPARHVELGAEIATRFRVRHPPEAGITQMIRMAELVRMDQAPGRFVGLQDYFVWPPASL